MYQHIMQGIKSDPAASYWLKQAVEAADKRDLNDALADVERLLYFLKVKEFELHHESKTHFGMRIKP